MEWHLDLMGEADWEQVREIFVQGIETGKATFETDAPSREQWDSSHLSCGRLVARGPDGRLLGWAALARVSPRRVYRGVAEVSIYVRSDCRGQGVGLALLTELVKQSEAAGLWTLQAHVFPENRASLRLHEKAGFREVGRRERLGQMGKTWRDVLLLERRSQVVGLQEKIV
jgi:phosphinothricin acetyltransferase